MKIEWQEILNRFLQSFKIGLIFREKEALIFKRGLSLKRKSKKQNDLILPIHRQIEYWRKANKKMSWGIQEDEFDHIGVPLEITEKDKKDGFISIILSYGFGEDGLGNSDSILSGKKAWEYANKSKKKKRGNARISTSTNQIISDCALMLLADLKGSITQNSRQEKGT